ncbi:hypothetical protein [Peribacillus acanthi]|uniref:hypothetical protein n=1 Tax=Peribacillus acanthi TaxID=2171554 RepID=UPI000D3EBF03|nr:hypothetical protein [Peribacillus acanthi]
MVILFTSIILFNFIAFKLNKKLNANQILHIWNFTIAFQLCFDLFIEFKLGAYWYFNKGVDWAEILPRTILVPPVNMMFLNWFPFHSTIFKKTIYIICWTVAILLYEIITLTPEPWGYFHYGWWKLWHAALIDPFLFLILVTFYKWICNLEINS